MEFTALENDISWQKNNNKRGLQFPHATLRKINPVWIHAELLVCCLDMRMTCRKQPQADRKHLPRASWQTVYGNGNTFYVHPDQSPIIANKMQEIENFLLLSLVGDE